RFSRDWSSDVCSSDLQQLTTFLPGAVAAPLMTHAGVDRLAALNAAIESVRRGGTISVIGVYGGMTDPMPMLRMFDKGITLRMGQDRKSVVQGKSVESA